MEFVFVVPRSELFPDCYPHGVQPFGEENTESSFLARVARYGFFVERAYAERNPDWKQVIPYTVVRRGDSVLLLRRTRSGGENRLHDKYSIGVGGHIEPIDLDAEADALLPEGRNPIPSATRRELEEELFLPETSRVRTIGILNDDSNPVGAVHVGVVQELWVEGPVSIREVDQLEGRMTPLDELRNLAAGGANLESWSSLLLPHLEHFTPEAVGGDLSTPTSSPASR